MKKHLVMLHGFGCDSRVFASIGTKLSKDLDVLMVDIPGHGQTPPEAGQAKEIGTFFSYCAYTINHALDNHLKEPYCLLGWSMGGQIALEMYKQSKKRCDLPARLAAKRAGKAGMGDAKCDHNHIGSLILISTTPKFVGSDDFPVGMNKAVFNKFKKGINEHAESSMDDFYDLLFSKNEDSGKYIGDLKKQTPPQKMLSACMESFEKSDERSVLPKIEVPTLIITGDSDRIVDPKASMFLLQEIKNSALKVFKGAGHAPHLTREKEVTDEIRKFIR
jgi:pimeloyl-[acyl-carrier protein] methyl ester esterase